MLRKILTRNKSKASGVLAALGAVLGIFLLCGSMQFYLDIRSVLDKNKELLRSDYIPVHKKQGNTLLSSLGAKSFSKEDIAEMERQPFSKSVGVIEQGLFRVSGSLSPAEGLPGMYTELYFESIDDKYIDITSEKWKWEEGSREIPVIMPASYLEMYNFGLAPSQNLPLLNEKSFGRFVFDIHIHGKTGRVDFNGRIAGFSQRINTILVPQTFLNWANNLYGYASAGDVVHVVWEVEDVSDPRVEDFLVKHRYETPQDRLSGSRAKSVLNLCLAVFVFFGSIMVLLSVMVFVQYNQLLITRKSYEIKVMFALGYARSQLVRVYLTRYIVLLLLIGVAALSSLFAAQFALSGWFDRYHLVREGPLYLFTWLIFGASLFFMMALNGLSIWRSLTKLAHRPA